MKDVPDVLGDETYNIQSLSVKLGTKFMFKCSWTSLFVLLSGSSVLNFVSILFSQISVFSSLSRSAVSLGLLFFAIDIKNRAETVDSSISSQVYKYYLHVWNIFYLCYLLLPFVK